MSDKNDISLNDDNPFIGDDKKPRKSSQPTIVFDQKGMELLAAFKTDIEKLNDPNMPYNEKLDLIIDLKTRIVPVVFKELYSNFPNPDISLIASRASFALKEAAAIIIKKRESEVTDEINPFSPKFQRAFYMFIELFHKTLQENNVDDITTNNVFNTLSTKLLGWEEQLVKSMKSVSSKALEKIENPFIARFKTELRTAEVKPEVKLMVMPDVKSEEPVKDLEEWKPSTST